MRNVGLDEAQAGIEIAGRNISNLRHADDTTLMVGSEEELKCLLMKVKEESEKVGLKLNIQKTEIMASSPITSWQIDEETVETVADFIFLGSKITEDGDCSHESKTLTPWKESYDQLISVQFSRSVVSDSVTPWITAHQPSLSITNSWSVLKFMLVMPSSYLILCCLFLLLPRQHIKKQRHYFINKCPSD